MNELKFVEDSVGPLEKLSNIIGKHLLKGYKMLRIPCNKCGVSTLSSFLGQLEAGLVYAIYRYTDCLNRNLKNIIYFSCFEIKELYVINICSGCYFSD